MKKRRAISPNPNIASPGRFNFPGLSRDGRWLVVDLAEHHFPRFCLKSHQPIEPPFAPITLTCYSPGYAEWQTLQNGPQRFALTKFHIIEGHKQQTRIEFELPLPLTPRWQTIMRSPWGSRLLWIGAVLLIVTYAAWISLHNTFDWTWIPRLSLVVALTMLAAGGAFQLFRRWSLRVSKLYDGKIWIGGVHREWLRRLPEFVPSQRMLIEEIDAFSWTFWICVVTGLFFLGIMIWGNWQGTWTENERPMGIYILIIAAVVVLIGNRARADLVKRKQQLKLLYPVLTRPELRRRRRR